ncbi:NgoFVII family restriction endonuclease [Aerococcaceae bacterium DSM 111020]|nr:NgoFVII family restriction endonuclease [Aerococcaceae bacterium DSM 111020]
MIVNQLYEKIFVDNARKYSHLRIISGYASANFLEKVMTDFPHLNIKLYLGMTHQPISQFDHDRYLIQSSKQNLRIYYQVVNNAELRPTHMKIYQFYNETDYIGYVGSANFSENGFFFNREILTPTSVSLDELFSIQHSISRPCSAPDIQEYINFINEENQSFIIHQDAEKYESIPSLEEISTNQIDSQNKKRSLSVKSPIFWAKRPRDPKYLKSFDLQIAQNASTNVRWDKIGINGSLHNGKSVLITSPQGKLNSLFDEVTSFKIYSDDGYIFESKLTGKWKDSLLLLNDTWYDYITRRFDISTGLPLSNEFMKTLGYEYLQFTRIGKNEYGFIIKNNQKF